MKINTVDGSIAFLTGTVQRGHDRSTFMRNFAGADVKEVFANEDWRQYDFDPETGIEATAFFKGERLDRVFILMSAPTDKRHEWTEAMELRRKAMHDAWLNDELGEPPYEYAWGSVTSDYDPRGCVSEIIVSYAS